MVAHFNTLRTPTHFNKKGNTYMINAEVQELKKRFKKDRNSFYRLVGCYVDDRKEKIYTFNKPFSGLPEDEVMQYLDIANKALGGKVGNNLLNVEFPFEAEQKDGMQQLLYKIRESEGKDEELLDSLYDKIIAEYQHMNHYLIVLFFDAYDVPSQSKEDSDAENFGEVFRYMLCAICPVELTKPNLGFIDKDNGLSITDRDWVVQAPESGFMFPSFNNRATDIHSALVYVKNARLPHTEMISGILECEDAMTSAQKKMKFDDVIRNRLDDSTPNAVDNLLIDMEYQLNQMIEAHKVEHGDAAILRLNTEVIQELIDESAIPEDKKDDITDVLVEIFEESETPASVFVTYSNMRIGEERSEKKALANILNQKEQELESLRAAASEQPKEPDGGYKTKVIDGIKYMLVPTAKNTTVIDGVEYVLVQANDT
jgi:hypothetical protein